MQPLRPVSPPARWRCWPAVDRPLRGLAALGLGGGICLGIFAAFGRIHLAVLVAAALGVGFRDFFLPVHYELTLEGIERRRFGRVRRIPWERVMGWKARRAGLFLVARPGRTPADAVQGFYLPWGSQRDAVLASFRSRLAAREMQE